MSLSAVSSTISALCQSIPGSSVKEKIGFVARQTFATLPWVGAGFPLHEFLQKLAPNRLPLICYTIDLIPYIKYLPGLSPCSPTSERLFKLATGMQIVWQLNQCTRYAKMLGSASTKLDQLYFLALTYSALKDVYLYFQFIRCPSKLLTDAEQQTQNTTPIRPTKYTLALLVISFALQLKYAPKSTIGGFLAGALWEKSLPRIKPYLKKMLEDLTVYNEEEEAPKLLQMLQLYLQPFTPSTESIFSNPQTAAAKCYHVWLNWDFFTYYISSNENTFFGGCRYGQYLVACTRSYSERELQN